MRTNIREFDWYGFSKLNHENPDLHLFKELVVDSTIGTQIKRVPTSHRQKLLVAFQNMSRILQQKTQANTAMLQQAEFQKKVIRQQINIMKSELDQSIKSINVEKMTVEEMKKSYEKLKKKVENKKKEKQKKQIYFCPLCAREDLASREAFTQHMLYEHIERIKAERSGEDEKKGDSIPSDVKELILSLKDKQIQLMEMMLNKKKEMETQELQKAYTLQLKRLTSPRSFSERRSEYLSLKNKSKEENEDEELHGESQYLFYQKDVENNKSKDPATYLPRMLRNFDREQYYEIFSSNLQSSPQKPNEHPEQFHPQKMTESSHRNRTDTEYSHKDQFEARIIAPEHKTENNVMKNLSWDNSLKKPQQFFKSQNQSKVYNYTQNINVSEAVKKDKKYETIYREKKESDAEKITKGHIFNSGPLMDDKGDGSDFEDYFGDVEGQEDDQVDDEEIKVFDSSRRDRIQVLTPHGIVQKRVNFPNVPNLKILSPQQNRKDASYISSQENTSQIILEYSKDRSSLSISGSKDKSSQISLSNSFSKRGEEMSKDEETINLSDLRFSKLERQREKMKKEQTNQNIAIIHEKSNAFSKKGKNQVQTNILDQFKKQQSMFSYDERQKVARQDQQKNYQNSSQQQRTQAFDGDICKTRPSVLDEFIVQQSHSSFRDS